MVFLPETLEVIQERFRKIYISASLKRGSVMKNSLHTWTLFCRAGRFRKMRESVLKQKIPQTPNELTFYITGRDKEKKGSCCYYWTQTMVFSSSDRNGRSCENPLWTRFLLMWTIPVIRPGLTQLFLKATMKAIYNGDINLNPVRSFITIKWMMLSVIHSIRNILTKHLLFLENGIWQLQDFFRHLFVMVTE